MIEYILVVVVSVILIAALVEKMFKPMSQFMGGLMGSYVECLLETGELPRLSADAEDTSGECKVELMDKGQDVAEEGKGNKNDDDADSDKVNSSKRGPRSPPASGGNVNLRAASRSPFRLGGGQRGSAGIDGGGGARGLDLGAEQGGGGFWGSGGGGGGGGRRRERPIAFGGRWAEEVVKKKEAREKGKVSVPAAEGQRSTTPRKIAMKAPDKDDRKIAEFVAPGLDISVIVKYLLIAGIIIVIIVLIGGQIAQLSKSWEKGE